MKLRLCAIPATALLLMACMLITGQPTREPSPTQTSAYQPPTATDATQPAPTATLPPVAGLNITGSTSYDVRDVLTFTNQGPGTVSRLEITIALIRDYAPYQDVISFQAFPAETLPRIVDDYGNEYAYYEFFNIPPWATVSIDLQYRIAVNELHYSWEVCEGDVIQDFLGGETYIDTSSPQILGILGQVAGGETDLCVLSRDIYEYVIENLTYFTYNPDDVGASGALLAGGGDCTEFADLTIALHRVGGIPANFLEGVIYNPSYNGDVTYNEAKHDWLEVYLPDVGWVPVDATWGRSTPADRETYYAGMTSDHIIVTSGRNLVPLEGGHFYLWYYWDNGLATALVDEETWTITRVVE